MLVSQFTFEMTADQPANRETRPTKSKYRDGDNSLSNRVKFFFLHQESYFSDHSSNFREKSHSSVLTLVDLVVVVIVSDIVVVIVIDVTAVI